MSIIQLNLIQEKAYKLIQTDARFIYSIIANPKKPKSNFISMLQPYIGMFADGAEKWGRKVGMNTPVFSDTEKKYYESMRASIKFFGMSFQEFCSILNRIFRESDEYFANVCNPIAKLNKQYDNVGVDLQDAIFCGNTILCSIYSPYYKAWNDNKAYGEFVKTNSIIAGKLVAAYGATLLSPYSINFALNFMDKDYHFFARCPLKNNTFENFCLFSILCNINFLRIFVDKYFVDEFASKLRFAYLQYYYLTNFILEINESLSTNFSFNAKYKNDCFRNCMAHYGIGQIMCESDIIETDIMFGLTNKIFDTPYLDVKNAIYNELDEIAKQLEKYLF